jgi:hypothetical protein
MDKEDVLWLLLLVGLALVFGGLMVVVSRHDARDRFEKEAVQAGAARYMFDDAGDPHFEWRKP